ncbi:uncharacterized protein H6S33_008579 [Morchella sextelata]|uniref:uncharacterized protein n=1 Tax=Morchella sextelata TaxID=1174677 RepID=UPI001D03FA7C|nr:uncharacterized protein H6S33_008579 [Morchella sextelata]KAH0602498.1 hypothetical protein H6S33_008579 [Morchella sextelata]
MSPSITSMKTCCIWTHDATTMDRQLEKSTISGEETQDTETTTKSARDGTTKRTKRISHAHGSPRMANMQKATRTKTAGNSKLSGIKRVPLHLATSTSHPLLHFTQN